MSSEDSLPARADEGPSDKTGGGLDGTEIPSEILAEFPENEQVFLKKTGIMHLTQIQVIDYDSL